jgi:transposase-like protein
MDSPIAELMDEDACYAKRLARLHPAGPARPRHRRADRMRVHRGHRAPVLDYRCGHCRRVFNAFTGSALQGTRRRPVQPVLIVRGVA